MNVKIGMFTKMKPAKKWVVPIKRKQQITVAIEKQ